MEITVASSSIPDLAHAVYEDASFERQFSLRPYNYYAPETTTWWIIPEKDWPAYHRGKGVFERSHWPIDRVLCGLHIEKGFDRAVASPDTHTNYIMNADWTWHPFITDLRSGVITRTAQSICDTVGCPATIEIDCWALTAFDSTDGRDSRREDDDSEKTPPPDYLGTSRLRTGEFDAAQDRPGSYHRTDPPHCRQPTPQRPGRCACRTAIAVGLGEFHYRCPSCLIAR